MVLTSESLMKIIPNDFMLSGISLSIAMEDLRKKMESQETWIIGIMHTEIT